MSKPFQRRQPTEQDGMVRLTFSLIVTSLHSLLLGVYIFLQTERFYKFFFGVAVDNLFFVKQAGLFLFCIGLFYLVPLRNLKTHHRMLDIIILTKVLAVLFLLSNYALVPQTGVIFIAALIDAMLAIIIAWSSQTSGLLFRPGNLTETFHR